MSTSSAIFFKGKFFTKLSGIWVLDSFQNLYFRENIMRIWLVILILMCSVVLSAFTREYHKPKDENLNKKISQWQDYKFGLMMHWGPYSQWGVMESWTICSEDWIGRDLARWELS
jgi:Alpha-L-fucosidase